MSTILDQTTFDLCLLSKVLLNQGNFFFLEKNQGKLYIPSIDPDNI